jgi:N-acetyl-gamma-glutamyl-phosphate reductase
MQYAAAELARGAKVIDYSGDFRFRDPADYAEYARRIGKDPVHKAPDLLAQTVYGLPELIAGTPGADARLVGNPGCFAVSLLLGLAPAAAGGLIEPARIICDCKTAVSGAGKKPNPSYHYPARYDNMNAYKLAGHQHVCEVEKGLLRLSGKEHVLTFTPQVVPMCRGIMSCIYGDLADGIRAADVMEAYRAFYQDRRFVRLYDRTASVGTVHVRGTNFCNLIVDVDERNNLLRVISHIDNLMKGQAGNALQNMNILFGLPEDTGLNRPGQNP